MVIREVRDLPRAPNFLSTGSISQISMFPPGSLYRDEGRYGFGPLKTLREVRTGTHCPAQEEHLFALVG